MGLDAHTCCKLPLAASGEPKRRNNNVSALLAKLKQCKLETGKAIHAEAIQSGRHSNIYVRNALINMYAKSGSLDDARKLFDTAQRPTVVTWNVMILGYAANGQGMAALSMFWKMKSEGCNPDSTTFVAALKACSSLAAEQNAQGRAECRKQGMRIHKLVTESNLALNIFVQNALVDMYANSGSMSLALSVFESIPNPDTVSWNALIMGYAENGQSATSLETFSRMKSRGFVPDCRTMVAVLKACSLIGALQLGRSIHSQMDAGVVSSSVILVTCLVDFYAKCGSLEEAVQVFEGNPGSRNVATWNALLGGFSQQGNSAGRVLELLERMMGEGVRPNAVTLLCVLSCCCNAGLAGNAHELLQTMATKFGVAPSVEHYNCVIDVLGRCNRVEQAMALLRTMPCSPDAISWMTVLRSSSVLQP